MWFMVFLVFIFDNTKWLTAIVFALACLAECFEFYLNNQLDVLRQANTDAIIQIIENQNECIHNVISRKETFYDKQRN